MRTTTNQYSLRTQCTMAVLMTAILLSACTGGARNFDYPEAPIKRGSF